MKHEKLSDIRHESHPSSLVCEWDYIEVENTNVRVYYKPRKEKGLGFDFYAFERTGYSVNEHTNSNKWHKDYCEGECLFHGIAYFDGIRHLYYGDDHTDNYGYHYCANLEYIISALSELRALEKIYCKDS